MAPKNNLLRVLDPRRSFVVVACAGSGKTWLLIARILRAMLDGARPEEILAITFTRKATGEIAERIRARLEEFASAESDAELAGMLKEIGADTREQTLRRARGLRRKFLLSERGMHVKTFHSWFQQILRYKPWLPDASGARDVAESEQVVLDEAWRVFLDSVKPGDPAGKGLLDLVRQTDFRLQAVREILAHAIGRGELRRRLAKGEAKIAEKGYAQLDRLLGIHADFDPVGELRDSKEFWDCFDRIRHAAERLGAPTEDIGRFLDTRLSPERRKQGDTFWPVLNEALFTQSGTLRKKGMQLLLESSADDLKLAEEKVKETGDKLLAVAASKFNRAAMPAVMGWLRKYEEVKRARGEVDYVDIEIDACELLLGEDRGSQQNALAIQYKMGQTYKHILVDEFQDTNGLQWSALRSWLEGMYGSGDEPKVFIVGDPKQSIYRFRGGDPRLLEAASKYLGEFYGAETVPHNETRRCSPRLLDVVNQLFRGEMDGFEEHSAFAGNSRLPGRIELLPFPEQPESENEEETEELRNPLTTPAKGAKEVQAHDAEALQIVAKMREIKENWAVTERDGTERACEWRDIMALFAQRTRLHGLELALRTADIPCASDRGGGMDSLECSDMIALMEFIANPAEDLALLQILRSPLFGAPAEDLAVLARRGPGAPSMWENLVSARDLGREMRRARETLAEWREEYLQFPLPAHDFLNRVYSRGQILERYELAVPDGLRHRVRANLVKILHLTLSLDKGRHPQLPRFLRELKRLRDAGDGHGFDVPLGDEVALLTIHSAKGLERPFVFVFDAARPAGRFGRDNSGGRIYYRLPHDEADAAREFVALGLRKKDSQPKLFREVAKEEDEAEERERINKLYVALTRARQAVIVSGLGAGGGNSQRKTWYDLVKGALRGLQGGPGNLGESYGDALMRRAEPAPAEAPSSSASVAPAPAPAPDTQIGEMIDDAQTLPQQRGELLHALLALRIGGHGDRDAVRRAVAPANQELFDELWGVSEQILGSPEMRELLGSPASGQVACEVGMIDDGGEILRIDCIAELGEELWILDFKSGEIKPHLGKYRQQMSRYRKCLRTACPGKQIRCALVSEEGKFTEV